MLTGINKNDNEDARQIGGSRASFDNFVAQESLFVPCNFQLQSVLFFI